MMPDDHSWGPTLDLAKKYAAPESPRASSENGAPATKATFDLSGWMVSVGIARDSRTADNIALAVTAVMVLSALGVWFVFGRGHVNRPVPQQQINEAFLESGVQGTAPTQPHE